MIVLLLSAYDISRSFPAGISDLSFEVSDSGLPRVILDDVPEGTLGDAELFLLQSVLLHLLRHQVLVSDVHLLLFGVAG